ncbi:class I SAM-dependent methyltransferase [Sediminibacillus albus]|uniref:Ubiquinone/menaquinone biosynthesis C-methylase UbiE n=1 Tax=Sediminibacillus albus TaxID=407036 RepID=A0A1G9D6T0_9BACI|nr:class I SAM-dependent methyltransferase [Sediminibacillus albus]SDK59619.1 Ubiquinone/menaquinone biosynthesis C-methylase UbiE [Sediminibacillus albus]
MAVDFHSKETRLSYTNRDVDPLWENILLSRVNIEGSTILDLGCGGGIYTKALAQMGAKRIIGLDYSKEMLRTARKYCKNELNTEFIWGDAANTELKNEQFDLILNRAVIHHLTDLPLLFKEIHRLLKPGGIAFIQDRTLEDCLLPGNKNHIRGYFFEAFPNLITFERERRPLATEVEKFLHNSGFSHINTLTFWETRKHYNSFRCLEQDIKARTGRSILHELSDKELNILVNYIKRQLNSGNESIHEKDRWTIWTTYKNYTS